MNKFKKGQIIALKEDGSIEMQDQVFKKDTLFRVEVYIKKENYLYLMKRLSKNYEYAFISRPNLFRPLKKGNERFTGKKTYESQFINSTLIK